MKALVLESNGVVKYEDVPDPVLAPDEYLVSVNYAGICNSDLSRAYNSGAYNYPLIMGHEIAGKIVKAGTQATRFTPGEKVAVFPLIPCKQCEFCKKGDYIFCKTYDYYGSRRDGGFSEFLAVKEWNLFPVGDIPLALAALLEPIAVAMHATKAVDLNKSAQVVIIGGGLIGQAIALKLREEIDPGRIYLVDRNDYKLDYAGSYGINVLNVSDSNWKQQIMDLTAGGAEVVFEVCGAIATYRDSLEIVRSRGAVVWVGNIQDDLQLPKAMVSSILRRELAIKGVWNSNYRPVGPSDWQEALDFILRNQTILNSFVKTVPLKTGSEFLQEMKNRTHQHDNKLKYLFAVDSH